MSRLSYRRSPHLRIEFLLVFCLIADAYPLFVSFDARWSIFNTPREDLLSTKKYFCTSSFTTFIILFFSQAPVKSSALIFSMFSSIPDSLSQKLPCSILSEFSLHIWSTSQNFTPNCQQFSAVLFWFSLSIGFLLTSLLVFTCITKLCNYVWVSDLIFNQKRHLLGSNFFAFLPDNFKLCPS